jgi:glycosyltransferase involved in cell wall biosynthesis
MWQDGSGNPGHGFSLRRRRLSTIAKEVSSRMFAESLESRIHAANFDIMHARSMHEVPADLVAMILSERHHYPYIITLRGSDVSKFMPRYCQLYLKFLENVSATMFVSNALLQKAKSLGFSGKNAYVIPKAKFIVVGDGHLRSKIEQGAKEKALEISFAGRLDQSEVTKYMNAIDIMVLPSRNEGRPCVVSKAQTCGTFVVTFDSSEAGETIISE